MGFVRLAVAVVSGLVATSVAAADAADLAVKFGAREAFVVNQQHAH